MTITQSTRVIVTGTRSAESLDEPRPRGGRLLRALLWVGLAIISALQLLPFWIAFTTSLKSPSDTSLQIALPGTISWDNYAVAINDGGVLHAIVNSVIVTVVATSLTCILGAFAAYPLARLRSRVNTLVLASIVALIMVPPLSILVPLYSFLADIGATNTYWGIILVMVTGQLPLAIFLYAAFIRSIPVSLEEAAGLDGAGPLRTFAQVIFPLLKPVTATVIILTSVNVWNEYALSGYILSSPAMKTIAPSIASFFGQQGSNLGAAAAAALIAVLPVLVAYLFLQQYFIRGMVAGAEK